MNITLQLGKTLGTGQQACWSSKVNPHLNISGLTGNRKSTLLRSLISQLPEQNIHVCVLDFAGDFCDTSVAYPKNWPPDSIQVIHVQSEYAPISSMPPWPLPSGGQESANQYADRIAGVLQKALRLGTKQWAYLYGILKEDFERCGTSSIPRLLGRIEEDAIDYPEAESMRSRLAALSDYPETSNDCYEGFSKPGVTVIDAQDIRSEALRSLVTEILLGNLWANKLTSKTSCGLVMVLDEASHLRFDDDSMAQTILREGRKYSIGGWFSSQRIDNPAVIRALGQAALQIYFRPDDWEIERVAKRLTQGVPKYKTACKRELIRLQPGQFIFLNNGTPVKVDGNTEPREFNVTSKFIRTDETTRQNAQNSTE